MGFSDLISPRGRYLRGMIQRDSLLSLEAYAKQRSQFRAKVMEHKKRRTVHLGGNVTLQFEDELTVRYQVQEMLRIERIFEEEHPARARRLQPACPTAVTGRRR